METPVWIFRGTMQGFDVFCRYYPVSVFVQEYQRRVAEGIEGLSAGVVEDDNWLMTFA